MNLFHPNAAPYKKIHTDHESKFRDFMEWQKGSPIPNEPLSHYVIQFVKHPNFQQDDQTVKTVLWFEHEGNAFVLRNECPSGYKHGNCFKNFKTEKGQGHPNGFYYELNMYLPEGQCSNHHTCTRIEQDHVPTKGVHW